MLKDQAKVLRDQAKMSKAAMSELKSQFRKARHKNKDDALTQEWNQVAAIPTIEKKESRTLELLIWSGQERY